MGSEDVPRSCRPACPAQVLKSPAFGLERLIKGKDRRRPVLGWHTARDQESRSGSEPFD